MEEKNTHNLEDKIMTGIESGNVKMRSRFILWSEKIGIGGALTLMLLAAVLACALTIFYLFSADSVSYLQFGQSGFLAFIESIPFPLVIIAAVFLVLVGYMFHKTEHGYKYSYSIIAVVLFVLVLCAGSVFSKTSIPEHIAKRPFAGPIMHPRLGEHTRGVAGLVTETLGDEIIVHSPHSVIHVYIKGAEWKGDGEAPTPGIFIMAIGKWDKDIFAASHIRQVDPQELRILRHRIEREAGVPQHFIRMMPPPMK